MIVELRCYACAVVYARDGIVQDDEKDVRVTGERVDEERMDRWMDLCGWSEMHEIISGVVG